MNVSELPRDLDGWPYRLDTDIGPWKVSPCCGAFVGWNNTGVGPVLLVCKRCYEEVPEDFRDEPPRLAPEPPRPSREPFKLVITLPTEAANREDN